MLVDISWIGARDELDKDLKAGDGRRLEGGKKQPLVPIVGPRHKRQSPFFTCWFE